MSIRTYQVTAPAVGSGAVKLIDLPPGPASVVLSNANTVAVSYGTGQAGLLGANGGLIPPNASVTFGLFPGSAPQTIYVVSTTSTTGAVSATVSSPN